MTVTDLQSSDPLHWVVRNPITQEVRNRYAVVVEKAGDVAICAEIHYIDKDTKCFDEGGSNEAAHQHNVRLKHAPPPFRDLAMESPEGRVYAYANPNCPVRIDDAFLARFKFDKPDKGRQVNPLDMKDIRDHFWRDELSHGVSAAVEDAAEFEGGSLLDFISDAADAVYCDDSVKADQMATAPKKKTPMEQLREFNARRAEAEKQSYIDGPGF